MAKWQGLVDKVRGDSPPDFDNQTLAVLRGRLVRYLMRSKEVRKSIFSYSDSHNKGLENVTNVACIVDHPRALHQGRQRRRRPQAGGARLEDLAAAGEAV